MIPRAMPLYERKSDEHVVRREATDFYVYRLQGPLSRKNLVELTNIERELWENEPNPHTLVFVDMRGAESFSPGLITDAVSIFRNVPPCSIAVVSGNFFFRTASDLFARVMRGITTSWRTRTFESEAEALEWLEAERLAENEKGLSD